MENQKDYNVEEIFSKALRAGRRTYFFDVRETKAGDYYLTITESKKFTNEDGTFYYKKHKIYLYKEDFAEFNSSLKETCDYIIEKLSNKTVKLEKLLTPISTESHSILPTMSLFICPLVIFISLIQFSVK